MNRDLARTVRERADGRCEYCRIPQFAFPLPFQIDHIIAEQHGGEEEELHRECSQTLTKKIAETQARRNQKIVILPINFLSWLFVCAWRLQPL